MSPMTSLGDSGQLSPDVANYVLRTSSLLHKTLCKAFNEGKPQPSTPCFILFKMPFPRCCLPPQQEHVIAIEDVELFHSGCLWKSMWAIMMERERGEGEGEREERRKRRSLGALGGLLSSSTAANSITVHMCKHLRYLLL